MTDAILHNLRYKPKRFKFLALALKEAWRTKATGYIVTPTNEIINIKQGKRKGVKNKWIPCDAEH